MFTSKDNVNRVYGQRTRIRVCGLLLRENKLLVIAHKGIGEAGILYLPPGGGLEFGETLDHGLTREFLEETGLHIKVENLVYLNEFIEPPLHALELFYAVTELGGKLTKGNDPEFTAENQLIDFVEFMSLQEIKDLPVAVLHPILQNLQSWDDLFYRKL